MRFSNRFFAVFFTFLASAAIVRPAVAAQAYVIVDSKTGYVLEEQEPRKKLQVGSLTKIATARWSSIGRNKNRAISIRWLRFRPRPLSASWKTTSAFSRATPSRCAILLYAALVQSDNIAAYTLAHHVGSRLGFALAQ